MKGLDIAAAVLILIGAFNWGLVGLFDINLIDLVVENPVVDRFVYALIGVAAIYKVVYLNAIRARWKV